MKLLLAICLAVAFTFAHAADKPAAPIAGETVKGEILETMDAAGFTYMRLKTGSGEVWTAVRATPVTVGAQVTVENGMTMKNFESKTLKRSFPSIVLGDLAGATKSPHGGGTAGPHTAGAAAAPEAPDAKVPKATGANARTVKGEILTATALDARNTFESPDAVKPTPFTGAALKDSKLSLSLPAKSVVVLSLK